MEESQEMALTAMFQWSAVPLTDSLEDMSSWGYKEMVEEKGPQEPHEMITGGLTLITMTVAVPAAEEEEPGPWKIPREETRPYHSELVQ